MKFKTLLLASAAVLVAAPAFAADDITAAFYTPAKGHFLSDTTLQGTRLKSDYDDLNKSLAVTEELNYGVTDNLAVFGAISNNFDVEGLYNNDHNFAYDLGVAYTMNYGKVLGQAVLGYHTFDPRTWYGKDIDSNRWGKELYATAKLGYAFDCGLTPYTTFTMVGDIDNAAYADEKRDQAYSWFLGAHKMLDRVSLDGGFRYDFGNGLREDMSEQWYVQAEANYFVKDNMTVGVFGDYYLGGQSHKDIKYGYTWGLNAKVAF